MLAIGFRFLGGRYHATPWGRHVNEADVEWPPSPWRFLRALIAVWHQKLDRVAYPEERLKTLLEHLTGSLPHYRLIDAVHSHVRHYMPVREGAKDKRVLIFDAFARMSPEDELIAVWPTADLDMESIQLLDVLLVGLNYLGRAESWVEGRRLETWEGKPDCAPSDMAIDLEADEPGEIVALFCPLTSSAYIAFREQWLKENSDVNSRKKKTVKADLPASWIDALSLETSDMQAAGWSQPPAARRVYYYRPRGSLKTVSSEKIRSVKCDQPPVTTVRFALYGKPLPRLEDAVRIGELTRIALIYLAEKHAGRVPAMLSGHELPEFNPHLHAFFLPEGNDHGRIDHVMVYSSGGFEANFLQAMQKLSRLYTRDGSEWQVFYEGAGNIDSFEHVSRYARSGRTYHSITPYLRPWHIKKKFGTTEQIRRECRLRGFPEPDEVRILPEISVGLALRRPVHFHRFRSKRGLNQPDTHGSSLKIIFSKSVTGPLALGFGCHFGLGLFGVID